MYTFKSRVRFSECDSDGKLTTIGLINYLQDCCTMQAEDLDIGISYLKEQDLGWFITNWDICINDMPSIGEEIYVSTWPYKFSGFIGYRNFKVENASGDLLAYADSLWVLMNLKKQAPSRLPDLMKERYTTDPALETNDMKRKLKPTGSDNIALEFKVDKMYLDTNFHMNNSYYVQGAMEAAGVKGYREIIVEYKKSAQYQDCVKCAVGQIDGGTQVDMLNGAGDIYAIVQFNN